MSQINDGIVSVVNNSATVRSVYVMQLTNPANFLNFAVGDEVKWGVGAAGDEGRGRLVASASVSDFAVRRLNDDSVTDRAPATSDIITKVSDATTYATISYMDPSSPPNWSNSLLEHTGSKLFSINSNTSVSYEVVASTADTLTISSIWGGPDIHGAQYGISTDFTPNVSLPMISSGDIDQAGLVANGFIEIDRRLAFRGARAFSGAASASIGSGAIAVETFTDFTSTTAGGTYDVGGWVATAGDGYFTVPAGVAKVRVYARIEPSGGTSTSLVGLQIKKNASDVVASVTKTPATTSDTGVSTETPPIVVATGDTFRVYADWAATGSPVVPSDTDQQFSIEAVQLAADDT